MTICVMPGRQSGGERAAEPEPPSPTAGRGAPAIDGRPLDVSGIKVCVCVCVCVCVRARASARSRRDGEMR